MAITAPRTGSVAAYIPCYNNAETIRAAVESVLRQGIPPAAVHVIDDGSTDRSLAALAGLPINVVAHEKNLGRGAARARAIVECEAEFVLCCDATNTIGAEFLSDALPWFNDPRVAAVFGRVRQAAGGNAVRRWRSKHLFKLPPPGSPPELPVHGASFATPAAVVRRTAVLAVGNFNPRLRHSEDAELGAQLLAAGWDVVCDPALQIVPMTDNTLVQVLERYWRWYAGKDEKVTWRGYLRNVRYSLSVGARDALSGDYAVAGITLLCPHFCFWRSLRSRRSRR